VVQDSWHVSIRPNHRTAISNASHARHCLSPRQYLESHLVPPTKQSVVESRLAIQPLGGRVHAGHHDALNKGVVQQLFRAEALVSQELCNSQGVAPDSLPGCRLCRAVAVLFVPLHMLPFPLNNTCHAYACKEFEEAGSPGRYLACMQHAYYLGKSIRPCRCTAHAHTHTPSSPSLATTVASIALVTSNL